MSNNLNATEFNDDLKKTLVAAKYYATRMQNTEVTSLHLAFHLLSNSDVEFLLNRMGVRDDTRRMLKAELEKLISGLTVDETADVSGSDTVEYSRDSCNLVQRAFITANKFGEFPMTGAHLLEAYVQSSTAAGNLLKNVGVTPQVVRDMMSAIKWDDRRANNKSDESLKNAMRLIDLSSFSDPAPEEEKNNALNILEKYTTNLNTQAALGKLDRVIGREREIDRAIRTLSRRKKSNLIFVGDPGVGKTAIVVGLAKRIVEGKIHSSLSKATIFELNVGELVAGTKYRGDFEKKVKIILECLAKLPDAILFIDEIHTAGGAGMASGSSDLSNLLKPALASGAMRCIGSTTQEEYRKYFECDRALARRFLKLDVKEPSVEESVEIIQGLKNMYEAHHGVTYHPDAIVAACELSSHYIHSKFLPDKAIDLIDEVGASIKLDDFRLDKVVSKKDMELAIAEIANIPELVVSGDNKSLLFDLRNNLKKSIIGQDDAITVITDNIIVARSGLRDENKPIGSFLFAGPTGVGKTELCKQVALELGIKFIRFDMSEYQESHTVSRFIGSPPGYVGHESGGILTETVNANPHCLLLLDEIEKSNDSIMNVLLGLLDYGKMTDGQGREVDFRHVIIVMTTNQGAALLEKHSVGFTNVDSSDNMAKDIKDKFSPEFRNRLDAIVQFNKLTPDVMRGIVDKFIGELSTKLIKQNAVLHVTDEALEWLAENGFDPAMGARPLKRLIAEKISKPAAHLLVFSNSESTKRRIIAVDVSNSEVSVNILDGHGAALEEMND